MSSTKFSPAPATIKGPNLIVDNSANARDLLLSLWRTHSPTHRVYIVLDTRTSSPNPR